jgi:hypothetical protein
MPPGMPNGNGMGVGRQIVQQIVGAEFGSELIYSFVIIVLSLMIYFGTKELYELSNHKGIKYFRLSFLFFAIAYFFRSFVKFLFVLLDTPEIIRLSQQGLGAFSLFLLMYASSMAVFYLLLSVNWKKWNGKSKEWVFHVIAIILAVISLLVKQGIIILGIYLILFTFVLVATIISYKQAKEKRKGSHLHGIYVLLFVFWVLNMMDILTPNFFQTFHLLIYFASIGVFLAILHKVLRKLG